MEKLITAGQCDKLLKVLEIRFNENARRHEGLEWTDIKAKMEARPEKIWSLGEMESTGGEPDVVGLDQKTGEYIFYDCSAETPSGRRNLCYDREALDSRKSFKPENNAVDMATTMGIELLTEEEYFKLQQYGDFDTRTSSWVRTPDGLRRKGGALFGDRRYGRVFIYHNGASSYYASRGFRGSLKV